MQKSRLPSVRLSLLGLWACACAAPAIDPREILGDSRDALRRLETVSYRFELRPLGASSVQPMRGEVSLERLDLSGSGYRALLEAEVLTIDGITYRLAGVKQSERIELLDGDQRVLFWSTPYSGGTRLVARMFDSFMYPFFDPESLQGEIDAAEVTWEGTDKIGGAACDWVRVQYEGDEEDSRWCIGTADRLPRAMEWISPEGGSSLYVMDLRFPQDPVFPSFEAPEGYLLEEVTTGPPVGTLLESWSLARPDGTRVASEMLRGQVVVLDFWATWCPPCRAELLALDSLLQEFDGRPVTAYAVNTMESLEPGDPVEFATKLGISFEVLLGGDDVHNRLAPGNLPALAVIDADGRLVGVTTGYLGEGSDRYIRRLIETALTDRS